MNIRDFIPEGRHNRITKKELMALTGLSERKVRSAIEHENQQLLPPIINCQDGKGYFIATEADIEEYEIWRRQELSRAHKLLKKVRSADAWRNNIGQYEMKVSV